MIGSNGLCEAASPASSKPALAMPPGEKAALFYHRLDDVFDPLADLLKDSIRQEEMCKLLFRSPPSLLREKLRARGLDLDSHPSIEAIPLEKTIQGNCSRSNFKELMQSFVQKAKGMGYAGTRLIINIPEELNTHSPGEGAWLELDDERDELGVTMVCLYDMTSLSPGFLLRSLASYPNIIMDGVLCRNFYHIPRRAKPLEESYRDLFEHLDNIKEELDIREKERRERSMLIDMNRELPEEIVHRRMVEFALLRAENNLRTMLDAMPEMVFMIDRELRVTIGNHTFVKYLKDMGPGTSYEGRSVFELFPDLPNGAGKLFNEVFHFAQQSIIEGYLNGKFGPLAVETRLVPVMMGDEVDSIVVIVLPKGATVQDAESWRNIDALKNDVLDPAGPAAGSMDSYPIPIVVTDQDGAIHQVNMALCYELGCTKQEVLAMGRTTGFLEFQMGEGKPRRINADGRISIPSIIIGKGGSRNEAICYLAFIGKGKDARVITTINIKR